MAAALFCRAEFLPNLMTLQCLHSSGRSPARCLCLLTNRKRNFVNTEWLHFVKLNHCRWLWVLSFLKNSAFLIHLMLEGLACSTVFSAAAFICLWVLAQAFGGTSVKGEYIQGIRASIYSWQRDNVTGLCGLQENWPPISSSLAVLTTYTFRSATRGKQECSFAVC